MTHVDNKERGKKIIAAVDSGESPVAVADRFGVTMATVYRHCRGRMKPNEKISQSIWAVLEALLKTSKSLSEIAVDLRVSRQRVHQIKERAKKAGVVFKGR